MRKKNDKIYLLFVFTFLFVFSIGYAVINRTLIITGNSEVKENTWDIHFENIQIKNGSITANKAPTVDNNLSVDFGVVLNLPGDFYEFTVDVVNSGTIDAMIDSVVKSPTLTESQSKYLNYIIEYQNGVQIESKQLVKAKEFVRIKVRIEYRKDIKEEDLPSTQENLTLGFNIKYVQNDRTGTSVKNNGVKANVTVISGDGTKTSDEICIGEECFHVMYSDENTITMLAKYNLHVGGEYINGNWVEYGNEATGKQNKDLIGTMKGTTAFSSTNYWISTVSNFPSYVYSENSLLYIYMENYKTYLSTLGVTPIEMRLITKNELENLGCNESNKNCNSAPNWVFSTNYWTGTAFSFFNIWIIFENSRYDSREYTVDRHFGCRPVVTIPRSLI